MKNNKLLTFALLAAFTFGGFYLATIKENKAVTAEAVNVLKAPTTTYTNHDEATYYEGVSENLTGQNLITALNTLNNTRRRSVVNYGSMGTSASGMFKYTDYDSKYVAYDSNNQPYGTQILSFYSGNDCVSFNREHVWPASRLVSGRGDPMEDDIHMPRPTIPSENGSRGNSFFVEGMKSSSSGWDPAEESFGDATYRGDSARIIFYCAIADTRLKLVDLTNDGASNHTMGKLSDLIKWHLENPIADREKNRNEGAEYLQGNRNPFIDHPEYVCRIWGNTNDATRKLCSKDPYAKEAPTSISLSLEDGHEISMFQQVKIEVSVTPSDSNTSVRWSSSNTKVATIDETGTVKGIKVGSTTITATSVVDANVSASITLNVKEPEPILMTGVNITIDESVIHQEESTFIHVSTTPDFVYPSPTFSYASKNENIATIQANGLVKGVGVGTTSIEVTATQGDLVLKNSVEVQVLETEVSDYKLVKKISDLSEDDEVVISFDFEKEEVLGISGFSGNKDAKYTVDMDLWVHYKVKDLSANGFKLYDEIAQRYIAQPTSNEFKYSETGGLCSVNSDGVLTSNNRFLCKNSTYARFYSSIGAYVPFLVYKVGGSAPVVDTLDYITLTNQQTEYHVNDTFSFTGTCTAHYVSGNTKNVTPTSVSSPDMSTVGEKTVTVTYTENDVSKLANYKINVTEKPIVHVTGVILDTHEVELNVRDASDHYVWLEETVLPANASIKEVTWESSDETVASVEEGCVEAKKAGNATITVKTVDGGYTDICEVTVIDEGTLDVYGIIIESDDELELKVNETSQIIAYAFPQNASDPLLLYESSDESVITVSNTGLITAIGEGEAFVIISSHQDPEIVDYIYITVSGTSYVDLEELILSMSEASIKVGDTLNLVVTYVPANASDKEVIWSSNNEEVATVDQNGAVTALKAGEATIAAASKDGKLSASCVITVTEDVKPVPPSPSSGCGGSIVATSVILSSISLIGIALLVSKKKHQ